MRIALKSVRKRISLSVQINQKRVYVTLEPQPDSKEVVTIQ